ncbi:hypothetical protein [Haloparvum sp. PAK95]|uniref:hypothetical protein n=1 Tax=Haloparvum sp. PAK95 TaxID=3418962 RepID=UPI003D2EFB41
MTDTQPDEGSAADRAASRSSGTSGGPADPDEDPVADAEELVGDLAELHEDVDSAAAREEIRELTGLINEARWRGLVGSGVRRFGARDAIEAFIGSVIFGSPLLIEDGVFDIADYLFGFTVSGIPIFLVANTLFVVLMTYALVEWTGRDRDDTHFLLGVVPVRVVMILVVSFVVAAGMMTVWGRIEGWAQPTDAVARVNVIWTVASLGAALGDIVSDTGSGPPRGTPIEPDTAEESALAAVDAGEVPERAADLTDGDLVDAILDGFNDLEPLVVDHEERREVQRIRERTSEAALDTVFGDRIRKYTSRDVAESFVGSIFFAIPFLVEDGVFDVAAFLLAFEVGGFPVFFLLNTAFILFMVVALVYWAGPQDVDVSRPILGFIPRRMVGIAVVSFLTAAALMTMWGRVANWQEPVVAVARISVVWTVASFGAALGDILPGESSGDDINDDLADLGEMMEEYME